MRKFQTLDDDLERRSLPMRTILVGLVIALNIASAMITLLMA